MHYKLNTRKYKMISIKCQIFNLSLEDEEDAEEGKTTIKVYNPVDEVQVENESSEPKTNKKKIVKHYDGINPEVEQELQRVIDELQQREKKVEE